MSAWAGTHGGLLPLLRGAVVGQMRAAPLPIAVALPLASGTAAAALHGGPPEVTAVLFEAWIYRLALPLACLAIGITAARRAEGTTARFTASRPIDGSVSPALAWLASLAALWLVLLAWHSGVALSQVGQFGLAGLVTHLESYLRCGAAVSALGTVGFAAAWGLRSPLGGLAVMAIWLRSGLHAGDAPALPACSAIALLSLAALLLVEQRRHGDPTRFVPIHLAAFGGALLLAPGSLLAVQDAKRFRAPSAPQPFSGAQHVVLGNRIPGLPLSDHRGDPFRMGAFEGKVLVVYFFSPGDFQVGRTLRELRSLAAGSERGIQPVGVCLGGDLRSGLLSRSRSVRFPILLDREPQQSPVAAAYAITELPTLVVTDRFRRAREVLVGAQVDPGALHDAVQRRLAAEPR